MKVGIIGTGYVGITLTCLADFGHDILLIDKLKQKIDTINNGKSTIFEPGLDEILKRNVEGKKIIASSDYNSLKDCDVIFLCVGTPSLDDGSIDLSQVKKASEELATTLRNIDKYITIVVKSTVVPSTTKNIVIPILEKYSGKKAGKDFGVCMCPEFLKEGTAVYDFLNPDKIVIGGIDEKSRYILEKLFDFYDKEIPRILTDPTTAEMIKYAQNAMLASRVSFINEMANICEKFNVDVNDIAYAIGLDSRIGPKFLRAGIGFGGSCFPKDVKALIAASRSVGTEPILLKSIIEVNEKQPYRLVELARETIGDLKNKKISILGLAFKSNTDDIRESRSIPIIHQLIEEGSNVKLYDPHAMENAKTTFGNSVEYCLSKEECVANADLCMIATEWDEFKKLDLSMIKCPIIDGRRILEPSVVSQNRLTYKGIGWRGN
jgi:UDPglucose 6-dehydrogenase